MYMYTHIYSKNISKSHASYGMAYILILRRIILF